jgi:pantoate--beta-alanine ligase
MKVLTKILEQRAWSDEARASGLSIGFVPTMGYLHEGHLSLVRQALEDCDKVVVSVFVNPAQFGEGEDLDDYPRNFERDLKLLEDLGVDRVFAPHSKEMYGDSGLTSVRVEGISSKFCGKSRPIHFDGVCLIVCKLFNIVKPSKAYFGQKDLQQFVVVQQMAEDLNFDVEVLMVSTVREHDGLAMSSRNKYLNENERKAATVLNKALEYGRELVLKGENDVRKKVEKFIGQEKLARIDYVEILWDEKKCVILLAVYFGSARLIDNVIIDVER